jgi:hypothetical protein
MASSIQDLADLIATLRSRHSQAFRSDLLRLRTQYGARAVAEAFALCRQAEARASVSVSGAKAKQRAERADVRLAQALFARRERS